MPSNIATSAVAPAAWLLLIRSNGPATSDKPRRRKSDDRQEYQRHGATVIRPSFYSAISASVNPSAAIRATRRSLGARLSMPESASRPSPRVDPLALRAEDDQRLGRAVDGGERVWQPARELGGLAGLEHEVLVPEHEPEPA